MDTADRGNWFELAWRLGLPHPDVLDAEFPEWKTFIENDDSDR